MVYFSCVSTKRSSSWSPSIRWKPPMRFRMIVAVAAFALAGCNANQGSIPRRERPPGSSPAPTFRVTMRMIPPNTRRRAACTPAVAVAVERARLRWPAKLIQTSAHKRQLALINASKIASVY
jgi:hypothetical protein